MQRTSDCVPILIVLGALLVAAPATAAPPDDASSNESSTPSRLGGTGIGFDSSLQFWSGSLASGIGTLAGLPTTGVRVPIDLSPAWQLEPNVHLGFRRYVHIVRSATGGDADRPATTTKRRDTTYLLRSAIDLKRLLPLGDQTRLHLGVTAGGRWDHARSEAPPQRNGGPIPDDFISNSYALFAGPTVGAEYFLSPSFSLGFEANLAASYGWSEQPHSPNSNDHRAISIYQQGVVALRAYF